MSEMNQRTEQGADVPPGGDGSAGDAPETVAAAQSKAQENWNSYMRAVAELDNYRKRAEREVDQARKYAIERFAQELLPVARLTEPGTTDLSGWTLKRLSTPIVRVALFVRLYDA